LKNALRPFASGDVFVVVNGSVERNFRLTCYDNNDTAVDCSIECVTAWLLRQNE
jgi:hypothetical protein